MWRAKPGEEATQRERRLPCVWWRSDQACTDQPPSCPGPLSPGQGSMMIFGALGNQGGKAVAGRAPAPAASKSMPRMGPRGFPESGKRTKGKGGRRGWDAGIADPRDLLGSKKVSPPEC